MDAVRHHPPLLPGVGVAVLAALSTLLGQSGVLFLNRVRGLRFLIALSGGVLYLVVLRAVEVLIIWGVAELATRRAVPVETMLAVGLLSMAPQVFHALTFLPHLGLAVGRVLEAWSFVVFCFLIGTVYGVGLWWGAALAASGWVVVHLLSRLLAVPLGWLGSRLWTLASGRPVLITSRDILSGAPLIPFSGDGERP